MSSCYPHAEALDEAEILKEAERHAFRMVGQDMQQVRKYEA